MLFTTYWFVLFTGIFFPVYWAVQWPVARRWWLLAGCTVFHYHFAGPAGMLPVIILGAVTYLAGLSRRRLFCGLAIALAVLALVFYKYTLFLSQGVVALFSPELAAQAMAQAGRWLPALPPLGISFFVFEFVHYLVEVYRGGEPIRRPADFALFSVFFPSLVAGPIKRYRQFIPSLHEGVARAGFADVAAGAQRIALGFFKKVVLADNLTLVINHYAWDFANLAPLEAWGLFAAIAARILFDFSGYSDIAIGLARMMGVALPENFHWPYVATNLQDFWQRWHISLSSWIRDYVYIPLGGNRHGAVRKLLNGLIAFTLCGIWHGPAWNFALWGLWHGLGLAVQSSYQAALGPVGRGIAWIFDFLPFLSWLLTILFVGFGWLLFFYPVDQAWAMAAKLLSFN
jgi:alginate O-acetyltransferase complex protein AlgI